MVNGVAGAKVVKRKRAPNGKHWPGCPVKAGAPRYEHIDGCPYRDGRSGKRKTQDKRLRMRVTKDEADTLRRKRAWRTTAHNEKQIEIIAVSNFLNTTIWQGLRVPIKWEPIAASIRHELEKLGRVDLAGDVFAENGGVTLRWTRLELKDEPGGDHTFVLDQMLWQQKKEKP